MHVLPALALCVFGATTLFAQLQTDWLRVESNSKQFVVTAPRDDPGLSRRPLPRNRIALSATLLAVSCERVRDALYQELALSPRWRINSSPSGRGSISLVIHARADDQISIAPWRREKGWNFRIDLPAQIEPARLVETIVHALLLDLASAGSNSEVVELPNWLSKGLIAYVKSSSLRALVLQSNRSIAREEVWLEPAMFARNRLREKPALSFSELSWPENLPEALGAVYADSALLFVAELLRLPEGRVCLRETIQQLGLYRNWQFAFLRGFHSHFSELSDVERWWALKLVGMRSTSLGEQWSRDETLRRLDAALRVPVNIHASSNALPQRSDVPIDEVVSRWQPSLQTTALSEVLQRLAFLRPHAATEAVSLINDYASVLQEYNDRREATLRNALRRGQHGVNPLVLRQWTVRRLRELDQKRTLAKKELAAQP